MLNSNYLTHEEQLIANRVNQYFLCPEMSMKDKLNHAILIAQHDLDSCSFCGEVEKNRLTHYKSLLNNIWHKMNV